MASWQEVLAPLVRDVEQRFDELKYRLYYMLGGPGPIKIVPYRGYGVPEELVLRGRVLEEHGITEAMENAALWENLLNMIRRMDSHEVPHARLRARFHGIEREVQADEEGMFEVRIAPEKPVGAEPLWHEIDLRLLEPRSDEQEGPVEATGRVLVPASSASFGIISDIDDTILQSDAPNLLRMARTVFLGNALTRLPFPGVAAFYRALASGAGGEEHNPHFYVSNSPCNLYDLLSHFFELQGMPEGPILLRNWGIYEDELLPTNHRKYKLPLIRSILDLYADLPFIFLGDSREVDPEIYAEVARAYPDRILAIYVRRIGEDAARSDAIRTLARELEDAGSALVLADDTVAMAQHAVDHGWIAPAAMADIVDEAAKDAVPPTPVEQLLGEPPTTASGASTVVVEG